MRRSIETRPDPDETITLPHIPLVQANMSWRFFIHTRDINTGAVLIKTPMMKKTTKRISFYTSFSKMGSHMRTKCINNTYFIVFAPINSQFSSIN